MSQENVDIVRTIYASLDRGDETVWDLLSPDFVVDASRRLIDPVVLRGRDEARALWGADQRGIWEEGHLRWEPLELLEAGDTVAALCRTSGHGKESGVLVQAQVWNVWTLRDGKAVELTYFGENRTAALEAVGLSE